MDKIKIYFLFTFIWVYSLPVLAYSAISPTTTKDVDVWAVFMNLRAGRLYDAVCSCRAILQLSNELYI